MDENKLTKQEEKILVSLLKKLKQGYYPYDVFNEFCRLNKLTAIEVVPFIETETGPAIVMVKRPENDKYWPNLYHIVGCILRPNDSIEDALNRVIKEELGNPTVINGPNYVNFNLVKSNRGNINSIAYWVQLSEIKVGMTFNPEDIPKEDNIVKGQKDLLIEALKAYNSRKE